MSLSEATLSEAVASPRAPSAASVRPVWLRPAALTCILALHAGLLFYVAGRAAPLTPLDAVDVTLEPEGDNAMDQAKQEEIKPAEAPPPPAPPPTPVEQAELAAPPPQVVAPEAIPLPVEKPKPIVKPKPKPVVEELDDEPTAAELRAEKKAREAVERRQKAQEARQAQRRGVERGARASNLSRGSYAGLLAAELRRHQFYPASARAQSATGSVGVAFTVGASGRVVSQSVIQSSGNAALDGAARTMMSAVHTPPPPGGSFSTSTTIRFHLN